MLRFHREILEWVEAAYGTRPHLLRHGRRHPLLVIAYKGEVYRFTISNSPSDFRAPVKARALIRRQLRG